MRHDMTSAPRFRSRFGVASSLHSQRATCRYRALLASYSLSASPYGAERGKESGSVARNFDRF